MWIVIILLLFILLFALKREKEEIYCHGSLTKNIGGNGKIHYKGRGSKDETVSQLLDRIYWVSTSGLRHSKWPRSYFIALFSTLIISFLIFNQFPDSTQIIISIIIIFLVSLSCFGFFSFHEERFTPYYIRQNIHLIRRKLGLKGASPLEPKTKPPSYTELSNLL